MENIIKINVYIHMCIRVGGTVRNGDGLFVFFLLSRLSVHSDGLFVLLDLTNIIEMESGEKKKL